MVDVVITQTMTNSLRGRLVMHDDPVARPLHEDLA